MIHCSSLTLDPRSALTCLSARFTTEVSSWAIHTARQVVNSTADLLSKNRNTLGCVVRAIAVIGNLVGCRDADLMRAGAAHHPISAPNATAATEASALAMARPRAHIPAMQGVLEIAEVAALVGDPTRANMLCALLDGRALTAGELAYSAGVAPQTASGHLAKLAGGRLLELVKQGRNRYFPIARPHLHPILDSIPTFPTPPPPL